MEEVEGGYCSITQEREIRVNVQDKGVFEGTLECGLSEREGREEQASMAAARCWKILEGGRGHVLEVGGLLLADILIPYQTSPFCPL